MRNPAFDAHLRIILTLYKQNFDVLWSFCSFRFLLQYVHANIWYVTFTFKCRQSAKLDQILVQMKLKPQRTYSHFNCNVVEVHRIVCFTDEEQPCDI